jgi:hypothetical protein
MNSFKSIIGTALLIAAPVVFLVIETAGNRIP